MTNLSNGPREDEFEVILEQPVVTPTPEVDGYQGNFPTFRRIYKDFQEVFRSMPYAISSIVILAGAVMVTIPVLANKILNNQNEVSEDDLAFHRSQLIAEYNLDSANNRAFALLTSLENLIEATSAEREICSSTISSQEKVIELQSELIATLELYRSLNSQLVDTQQFCSEQLDTCINDLVTTTDTCNEIAQNAQLLVIKVLGLDFK